MCRKSIQSMTMKLEIVFEILLDNNSSNRIPAAASNLTLAVNPIKVCAIMAEVNHRCLEGVHHRSPMLSPPGKEAVSVV